jgi:hypothetical protein
MNREYDILSSIPSSFSWKRKNLFDSILDKFQVIHDKQQHLSGPGGSFGYGGGGRRTARGGAYFPASFV